MYSRRAGTGAASASAGSQMRAASRQPSGSGIHQCSISRTACGNAVTTLTAGLPAAEGPPSCARRGPGLGRAVERRRRAEHHREPLAHEQTHPEVPAVDDREPEPTWRHGVRLERSILVEGDLDARHLRNPPELVHPLGIDPVPHPVRPEEDDAVTGTPRLVAEAPATPRIQPDQALEPSTPVEIDPLVREAEVTLDDRAADRLQVHQPRVAAELARQPAATVRLDRRARRGPAGPPGGPPRPPRRRPPLSPPHP